jgi:hypothetical protein
MQLMLININHQIGLNLVPTSLHREVGTVHEKSILFQAAGALQAHCTTILASIIFDFHPKSKPALR